MELNSSHLSLTFIQKSLINNKKTLNRPQANNKENKNADRAHQRRLC